MEIIWSPRAETEYLRDLTYLEENYGRRVATDYMVQVIEALEKISNADKIAYQLVDLEKEIRRYKVNKNKYLYYRIQKDSIELIAFIGSKQNPDTLEL